MCGPEVLKHSTFKIVTILFACFLWIPFGSPMSILNRAVTCQAVPDVLKPADVEAKPEELLGDVIHGEIDNETVNMKQIETTYIHPQVVRQRSVKSDISACIRKERL